jgi:hypothetical protein
MKKQLLKWMTGIVIMLFSISSWSQKPAYTCSITNAKIISRYEYEFDVLMQRFGTVELHLSHFQLGIILDSAIIPPDATIKVSSVPESSELMKSQQPGPERFSFDAKNYCIRVTPMSPVSYSIASVISSSVGGTKLCRIRVTCSKAFNKGISTNHFWNFSFDKGYATKIFSWKGSVKPLNTDITVHTSHLKTVAPPADVTFSR